MGKVTSVFDLVADGIKAGRERLQRARDTNYTTDTYHGSTHDLTEMDASKTNIEGDWGKGIYSSNNIDDVNENYAGVGPDLTVRIEQEADRLESELLDQFEKRGRTEVLESLRRSMDELGFVSHKIADMDDADAAREAAEMLARKTIKGENDGVVYPLKQNTEGFATIGGKDRTIVEGRDYHAEAREEIQRSDYDDEYDYEDAVDEYAFDLMNSDYDTNYQKVLEVIDRRGGGVSVDDLGDAFDGDSVDLTKLDEIIRESQIYAEDDAGNLIPNGAVSAEILQNLGFKGVIDNTANTKFGSARDRGRPMGGMDEDTVHYITFEGAENQIRSRNAQFKDPTSRNLLAGSAATAITLPAMFGSSETEAGFFSQAVKAAQNLTRKTGNAQGFKNDLTGKGQVKPDELKAMGFDEHFGDRKDITKEEVQQFINENQVQIKETVLTPNGKVLDDFSQAQSALDSGREIYGVDSRGNVANILDDRGDILPYVRDNFDSYTVHEGNVRDADTKRGLAKFGDYTLEGGDNYRELLLQDNSSGRLLDEINSLNKQIGDAKVALRNDQSALLNVAEDMQREADKFIGGDNTKENYDNYQRVNRELSDFQDGKPLSDEAAGKYIYGAKELIERRDELVRQKANLPEPFINSSHFDEPNILAHLRMKDRVDTDGNKTLLIEEAQSDWHQTGADRGYVNNAEYADLVSEEQRLNKIVDGTNMNGLDSWGAENAPELAEAVTKARVELNAGRNLAFDNPLLDHTEMMEPLHANLRKAKSDLDDAFQADYLKRNGISAGDAYMQAQSDLQILRVELDLMHDAVPEAPFKTDDKSSWYNLAMKRGLIEAAEGDYDKLAITTGRQQAERYDLSKTIGSLKYQEDMVEGRPVNILTAYDKQGMRVFNRRIDDPEKELPSIIGKDATKSLLEAEPYTPPQETRSIRSLRGQELSVGGEGMKEFYDRKLPNTLNKLVKQDGVKVGQSELDTGVTKSNRMSMSQEDRISMDLLEGRERAGDLTISGEEELRRLREKRGDYKQITDTVHSIDITPEMRERVKKGLPLFTTAAGVPILNSMFAPKVQAAEYNEAPVIEEQSFGDMVNEYGQINRNLKALDDQRFARAVAEREARRGMSRRERRDNPPSEALRELAMQDMKPSLGSVAQGIVEGNAQGLDYFHPLNLGRMILNPANEGLGRFIAPSIVSTYENAVSPVAKPVLFDERDPKADEKSRSGKNFGNFFSLF